MADDVLLNKAATIERCVARAEQEYQTAGAGFAQDFTRQDAAILNLQRACEAAIDGGSHLVRRQALGAPQSARDVFDLLVAAGQLDAALGDVLKRMTGFRNISVHDYQKVQIPIVVAIITKHSDDLLSFARRLIELS
ncbi:toxin-antitoxin antitoxin component [Halomonas sp. 1513]|nr:DUF86 domain-containing protein [Halomonas sp. 1513]APX94559.1 toxin-antitoxin antitoxin component [Halomonas sp. 1513]